MIIVKILFYLKSQLMHQRINEKYLIHIRLKKLKLLKKEDKDLLLKRGLMIKNFISLIRKSCKSK